MKNSLKFFIFSIMIITLNFNSFIFCADRSKRHTTRFNPEALKHCEKKHEGDEDAIDRCLCHLCWHSLEYEGRCMGSTDECVKYCKCPEPAQTLDEV
jgi:hypothetical protein